MYFLVVGIVVNGGGKLIMLMNVLEVIVDMFFLKVRGDVIDNYEMNM